MSLLPETLRLGEIVLELRGTPPTRHEPRITTRNGHGASYPDERTVTGLKLWRIIWQDAGCPHLPGPVELELLVELVRPPGHFKVDGVSLSAAGRRQPIPTSGGRNADLSNLWKLAEDALKRHAFDDDTWVGRVVATKRWTRGPARTTLTIRPLRETP